MSFPLLEFADTLIIPQPSPEISNTGIWPRDKQMSSKSCFLLISGPGSLCILDGDWRPLKNYYGFVIED